MYLIYESENEEEMETTRFCRHPRAHAYDKATVPIYS